MQHFPLRSSGRCILNYLNDWLILAQSLDTLISHIDLLLIHLESLGLCVNMQRAFLPPPLARSRGDESPPLARSRGDESLPLVMSRLWLKSRALTQPRSLQPGSSPVFGSVACDGHDGYIDSRLGSSVRGNTSLGTVAGISEPVAHKPPGAGNSLLSSKGFSATVGTAACTDSHRQHVCGFVYKSPERNLLKGAVQAGNGLSSSSSELRTSPVSWSEGRTCFRGRGFLKESGDCTPSRFGWFGTASVKGERRWICSPRARTRTARCSSLPADITLASS